MEERKLPTVSVLMSVYREKPEWLEESINSILNQTFKNFEFIIINDNPGGVEQKSILNKYQSLDDRIIVVQNPCNLGLTKSLNIGLKLARGKYIARMDADDISLSNRFLKQFEYLESHREIGVCGCNVETFGSKQMLWVYPDTYQKCLLFFRSPFAHPSVMIRSCVLKDNHIIYNENMHCAQDFDLWERLYPITQFANLQEVLLRYRLSDLQITKRKAKEQYLLSTSIKLRAFNTYCKCHDIKFQIENPITICTIKEYKKQVTTKQFDRNSFLPYLYRSISSQRKMAIIYFFMSGDFFRVSFLEGIKILLCLSVFSRKAALLSFS